MDFINVRNLLFETYHLITTAATARKPEKNNSLPFLLATFVDWNKNIHQWKLDELIIKTRQYLLQCHPDKNTLSNAETLEQAKFLHQSIKRLRDDASFWQKQKNFISCLEPHVTVTTTTTTTVKTVTTFAYGHDYLKNYHEVLLKTPSVVYFVQLLGDHLKFDMGWYSYIDQKCSDFMLLIESSTIQDYFVKLENFSLAILDLLIEKMMGLQLLYDQNYSFSFSKTRCSNEIVNQLTGILFWLPDFQFLTRQFVKRFKQIKNFPYTILDKLHDFLQIKFGTGKEFIEQFVTLLYQNKKKYKRKRETKTIEKKMHREPTWYTDKVSKDDQVFVLPLNPTQLRFYHIFQTLLLFTCYDEVNQCYYYYDLRTCYEILVEKMNYYSRTRSKREHPLYSLLLEVRDAFKLNKKKIARCFEALFECVFKKDSILKPEPLSKVKEPFFIFFKPANNEPTFSCMNIHYQQQDVPVFSNISGERLTLTRDQMRMLQFIPLEKMQDSNMTIHHLVQETFGAAEIPEYDKTIYLLKGYLIYKKTKEEEK